MASIQGIAPISAFRNDEKLSIPVVPEVKPNASPLEDTNDSPYKNQLNDLQKIKKKDQEVFKNIEEQKLRSLEAKNEALKQYDQSIGREIESPLALPSMLPEPEMPSMARRTYLSGEGKNALRQVVGGLSNLAMIFSGMGSPLAALNAISGAMEGWAAGDMDRVQRDFTQYEKQVEKVRRQNADAIQAWDHARVARSDDRKLQEALLQTRLLEEDLPVQAAQVGELGMDRSLHLWEMAEKSLDRIVNQENKLLRLQIDAEMRESVEKSRAIRDELGMLKIGSSSGGLTDEAITGLARRVLSGDTLALTNIGRGIQGANDLRRIHNKVYELAEKEHISPEKISARLAEFSALKSAERTLATKEANTSSALIEANALIPLMREASNDVPRSSWPIINKAIRFGALNMPLNAKTSASWQRFEVAINSFIPVYVRALKGTGVPDVTSAEHARSLLSSALNQQQFDAAIKQLKWEMEAALSSPEKARNHLIEHFSTINVPSSKPNSSSSENPIEKETNKTNGNQSIDDLLKKYGK